MAAPRDFIPPRLDLFSRLLWVRYPKLLRAMLEAVLAPPEPFGEIEVLNPELPADTVSHKGVLLDLRAVIRTGPLVDLEVQSLIHPGFIPRLFYYWARSFVELLRRGDGYEPLRPAVLIAWCARRVLPDRRRFHSVFEARERVDHDLLSDHFAIHLLELPHLSLDPPERRNLQLWSRFLAAETQQELDRLSREDPIMSEAHHAHRSLTTDPDSADLLRERQRLLEAAEVTRVTMLHEATKEAEKRGEKRGERRGERTALRRTAAAMKSEGFEVAAIARLLGVSEGDVVELLAPDGP